MNQAESGRSLIEMLAVIGIIGVLSVGVISTVRWGLVSGKTFSLQADVESAAQQLQELCSWNGDWDECNAKTTDLDLPSSLTLKEEADGILQTTEAVPVRVCRRLLNPTYTNWTEDLVGSIKIIIPNGPTNTKSIPIPDTDEGRNYWKSACGTSASGSPVTMEFTVIK